MTTFPDRDNRLRCGVIALLGLFSAMTVTTVVAQERCTPGDLDCTPLGIVQVTATPDPRIGGWSGDPGGWGALPFDGPGSSFCQAMIGSRPNQCSTRPTGIATFVGVPGPNSGLAFLQQFSQMSPSLRNAVRDALQRHSIDIFNGYQGIAAPNENLTFDIRVICDAQASLTPA